jgi:hypothetical protein
MSRVALVLFSLSGEALAHSGHGALESHIHASPEILLLAALAAAWAVIRIR